MTTYSIETFDKRTGAYQAVATVKSREEMVEFCTAEWRRESVHVVQAIPDYGVGLPIVAVFINGLCVSPLFNSFHK